MAADKLDLLLGTGTADAFKNILKPSAFRSNVTQYGWYFECDWLDKSGHKWAEIKIEIRSGVVYFRWYYSEDDGTLYKQMCDTLPYMFKALGCYEMQANWNSPQSKAETKAYAKAYWYDDPANEKNLKWPLS